MRVVLCLLLLALPAAAAPAIPTVEVELGALDKRGMRDTLTWTEDEPGGLLVAATAHKDWFVCGLKAGDVIVRVNGAPAADGLAMDEGSFLFEVLRAGKVTLLRTVVHGDRYRTVHLTHAEITDFLDDQKSANPTIYLVPSKRGGQPVGARVINDFRKLELIAGDVLRSIGRVRIFTEATLTEVVAGLPEGHTDMVVTRDGRDLTITLEREPAP